jgi:hypothetical protein
MELDAFYSECLGFPVKNVKSGKVRVVDSERRLKHEEGYGIIFPFLMLHSEGRYIISVRPDLLDLVSALVRNESDAQMLFKEDVGVVVESWCRSVLPINTANKLKRSHSFELYVDREHFRSFNLLECRRINTDDNELMEEMNKESDFWCPEECIQDGTAFGVVVDGKLVARSNTIITPEATRKYKLVWMGVETLSEYRRRGYAKAVISGTTETLLSRGLTPIYDHATWNIASGNTAKSLGYQFYGETLRWQY